MELWNKVLGYIKGILVFILLLAVIAGISAFVFYLFDAQPNKGVFYLVAFIVFSLAGWLYKFIKTKRYSRRSIKNGSYTDMAWR